MAKILVAYTTWAGATRDVGEKIAKELRNNNLQVIFDNAKNINSISDYSAVIFGTSIHMGKPTGDFKNFLRKFHKQLIYKKTALFTLSFNMIDDNEKNRTETLNWLKKVTDKYTDLKPISIGLFAGAAITDSSEYGKLNIFIKKMITLMKTNMETQQGKSDFRNWDAIQLWTTKLIEKIA